MTSLLLCKLIVVCIFVFLWKSDIFRTASGFFFLVLYTLLLLATLTVILIYWVNMCKFKRQNNFKVFKQIVWSFLLTLHQSVSSLGAKWYHAHSRRQRIYLTSSDCKMGYSTIETMFYNSSQISFTILYEINQIQASRYLARNWLWSINKMLELFHFI
jgi:hypothetical protein